MQDKFAGEAGEVKGGEEITGDYPASGLLKVDGVDCRDLHLGWLRSQIRIVAQTSIVTSTAQARNSSIS